jgi:Kef-type K+ transport system membrane component KefB
MTDLTHHSGFGEIAALLALASALGFIGLQLRQPLIVSFIAVGLLAGPAALDIVRSAEQIDVLSELGVAVLLFLVGVKLDVQLIRSLGMVSVTTGLGQVLFTSLLGFLIGLALGLDPVTSLYVAVALTFSSTIIIVKLLSDKREIDALHGQVALGFLIVQDLAVVFAMVALSAIGIGGAGGLGDVAFLLAAAAGMLGAVALFVRYGADPLTRRLSRSPELLVTFAIGMAAAFAAVADAIGLGKEIGGLLAGVALASTRFRDIIAARLAPLRDFLLLFFFVALGARLDLSAVGADLPAAAVFSLFVLIGNPLIVLAIMGAMGFRKRTGFLAGLTVAQISEFSLIFIAMGVSLGHVGADALGLVTLVGLITIAASVYMITWSHHLYAWCEPLLGVFERRDPWREGTDPDHAPHGRYDAVVVGAGRFGMAVARRLKEAEWRVLCVDFNPEALRRAAAAGFDVAYGDGSDPEFVAHLPLGGARWVVAAMPAHRDGLMQEDPRIAALHGLAVAGYVGRRAVVARHPAEIRRLQAEGADIVFEPFEDAADRAVAALLQAA